MINRVSRHARDDYGKHDASMVVMPAGGQYSPGAVSEVAALSARAPLLLLNPAGGSLPPPSCLGAVSVPPIPDGVDFHGVLVRVDAVDDPVGATSC